MMHYLDYAKFLALIICVCPPLESEAKPAKDPGETAEIPYVSATPDLLFPHSPTVVQPLDPQLNSDPVDVEGANMPIESDGGFPMENNKGDSDQGGNIQDKISPNEISKENQDDRQDLSFNGNDKSEVIPLTSSPKGNNKGDTGDDEQESTPGIGLIEATEVDVEAPASVETPRQQNMLSHAADKPEPASSEEEPLLSADVGTPPQQNIPPATDQLKLPVPLDPVITNGNLLTTTSVLPKRTQSVDQILFGVSSEVPSVSLSISSTESINDSPSSDKSSAVSEDGNPVNPEKQSEKSNAENNDDDAEDGNTPESFDNNAETSSNLTSDETKKTEKVASPSDTISQSIQTKSTLTTTEASSNSKSSTSMAAENAEEPDATITSELTETIQPDDHIDYPTPAETDEPLATQKPQSTLLTSNNPPKELAKPSKSTNDSIQVTTSSSSLQLTPSASLVQSHPQLNQSGIAVANNNEDDVKTTPSLKSLATTLTLTNNLPATIHASTSPPILSSSTTTTVKTTLYKTSSAKSTHVAMPEHADRSKTSPSTTSSTTLSTTTATSTKQAVSPAESSSKTPVIPDEEAEHNRKRPFVDTGGGREGGSSIDQNPSDVKSPTLSPVSDGQASTSSNSTNDQDFLSKVKGMVGDVEPFYVALLLLITLTLVLITCCCCCKLCSKKRRGIRHRRLKEYGKEKEFLLRNRGKSNNYQNDSVTLLQGSSEDEF